MQLYTLDGTSFLPNGYIQGYSSLIWTERYLSPGEFELVTAEPEILSKLPPGTLLCIQESAVIMMVDTVNLRQNEAGYPESVVTGRTIDAILDERVIWGPHGASMVTPRYYTSKDIALVCLWGVIVNATVNDVINTTARPSVLATGSYIPNVIVTDSAPISTELIQKFTLQMGAASQVIRDFLGNEFLGIRTMRPGLSSEPFKVVSVNTTNGASKGTISKVPAFEYIKARLDVFKGVDRTRGQTAVTPVVFVAAAGHLINVEILDSDKDFATTLIISTPATTYASNTVYAKPPPGFNTKVRYFDGSSLVEDLDLIDADQVIDSVTKRYWADHSGRAILDGDVSDLIPYQYGLDYFIGDLVTLQYNNLNQTVWVSEYTRAQDKDGERAYPTFSTTPSSESRALHGL